MNPARSTGLALVALAATLPAQSTHAADNDKAKQSSCAFTRSIDNWKYVDDQTVIIETSPQKKFKVTFVTPCREAKWAHFARIDPRPSSAVCLSEGDVIVFGRGAAPGGGLGQDERCMIQSIEPIAPAPKPN